MDRSRKSGPLEAIRAGRAFADLSHWRRTLVTGPDARAWLHDLLSADIAGIGAGESRRTLLLSPTGRIRADATAVAWDEGILLIQDPAQPEPIAGLLEPYVLSSEVTLEDLAGTLLHLAFPNRTEPTVEEGRWFSPSSLGPGIDLMDRPDDLIARATEGLTTAAPEDLEAWRIELGRARFPTDLTEGSLPHEAALQHTIDWTKGCYLGQEAVARVQNLGHPPTAVLAMRSASTVTVGEPVLANGAEVGRVTSAAEVDEETAVIARIRWADRERELRTESGAALLVSGPASGAGGAGSSG